MMNYPPLEELMDKVDSRYTLVVATSMRARSIMNDPQKDVNQFTEKAVSKALCEIKDGDITYKRLAPQVKKSSSEELK